MLGVQSGGRRVRTLAAFALLALIAAGPPPGVVNPNVTKDNIDETICVPGWTKTIRPSVSYTNRVKREMLGLAHSVDMRAFELDHFIPLELGGHPTDRRNLWPQPWGGKCGAHTKDAMDRVGRVSNPPCGVSYPAPRTSQTPSTAPRTRTDCLAICKERSPVHA